jgi:hypothetical protein
MVLKNDRMDLAGIAVDNNTVANFMDNLETILKMQEANKPPAPLYPRIRLTSVQSQTVRKVGMKKFQMIALEKQPPAPKPNQSKKKKKR